MNRLTKIESSSVLIKDGWKKKDTESYTSICYGCEEIGRCVNKCGFYKALEKLADYEDLEEQERLIKLPCKVGDTVYAVNCNEIIESTVTEITLNEKGVRYIRLYSTDDRLADFKYDYFKKTVFLTREEAEKALEDME